MEPEREQPMNPTIQQACRDLRGDIASRIRLVLFSPRECLDTDIDAIIADLIKIVERIEATQTDEVQEPFTPRLVQS